MNEKTDLAKWLRVLFLVAAVNTALVCLSMLSFLGSVPGWLSRAASAVTVYALFRMTGANERYRKAALFHGIALVGGIVSLLLNINLLTLAISICSLIGFYQEFHAHAELTADRDAKLSGRWNGLFTWHLVVGILGGLATMVGTVLAVLGGMETAEIVPITVFAVGLLSLITQVLYLLYMKKTSELFAA